jgi:hypothetical protein
MSAYFTITLRGTPASKYLETGETLSFGAGRTKPYRQKYGLKTQNQLVDFLRQFAIKNGDELVEVSFYPCPEYRRPKLTIQVKKHDA